ncbi:SDR family NAD(P)-dependent oxidoreductase [uncultured Phenylobacterium sp.]|uniref:SDR family NAD(P)-dependent oxidoreductase n=1 Tax=uncultured Phenylobacterium sp. TaxID=349273 RepID=UPI0025DF420F|nr:glucose 1-dehydrogenase [uncultured Phenylobacterium sp.]
MSGQLAGRVAVITGSGRGQGLVAAQLFAREGAKIIVNDLDQESVTKAVDSIIAAGGEAAGVAGDVANADDVQRVLAAAKEKFGRLDIIYNNAGIGFSATERMGIKMDDTVNCTVEDWQRILDINLTGVFLFCKFGIPLLHDGRGVIINTASIAALKGARNAHAYTATKGGVVALTRSLAVTYGQQGVRANTICPGVIDTEMIQSVLLSSNATRDAIASGTPVGRIGTPRDIAELALFLASDASSFITGQTIACDGGATA